MSAASRAPDAETAPNAAGGAAAAASSSPARLTARGRLALVVERAASAASKRLGRGSGEMIGGKAALRAHPGVMRRGRRRARAGLRERHERQDDDHPAARGGAGDRRPRRQQLRRRQHGTRRAARAGAASPTARAGALEVDEIWLPKVAREVAPAGDACCSTSLVTSSTAPTRPGASPGCGGSLGGELHGLHRRRELRRSPGHVCRAGIRAQVWVAAGQNWTADAMVCPSCGRLLERDSGVRLAVRLLRAAPAGARIVVLGRGPRLLAGAGRDYRCDLMLPGRVNVGNAAHAAAAAELLGVPPEDALPAMTAVEAVQGRYSEPQLAPGRRGRLLLAKNPAGWVEMLELLETEPDRPVIIDFNSRTADGRDPSWLWDVPFERLAGRRCSSRESGARMSACGWPTRRWPTPCTTPPRRQPPPRRQGALDVVAELHRLPRSAGPQRAAIRRAGRPACRPSRPRERRVGDPDRACLPGAARHVWRRRQRDGSRARGCAGASCRSRSSRSRPVSPCPSSVTSTCSAVARTSRRYWRSTGCERAAIAAAGGRRRGGGAGGVRRIADRRAVVPRRGRQAHEGVGLLPLETRRSFGAAGEPVPPGPSATSSSSPTRARLPTPARLREPRRAHPAGAGRGRAPAGHRAPRHRQRDPGPGGGLV